MSKTPRTDAERTEYDDHHGYIKSNHGTVVPIWLAEDLECEVSELREELNEAYAELRKQRRTITAVYNRDVWNRADAAGKEQDT